MKKSPYKQIRKTEEYVDKNWDMLRPWKRGDYFELNQRKIPKRIWDIRPPIKYWRSIPDGLITGKVVDLRNRESERKGIRFMSDEEVLKIETGDGKTYIYDGVKFYLLK